MPKGWIGEAARRHGGHEAPGCVPPAVLVLLPRPHLWRPGSARLAAVFDEHAEPGREPPGIDEVDEMPVACPLLDLGIR
jgi:hypothetical protein